MKNYIFATISLAAALLFTACDQEAPMDTDLYPQTAYIVGAHYRIIDEYLDLSKTRSISLWPSAATAPWGVT